MLNRQSVSEQAAVVLREDLIKRRWTTYLPGRDMLAKELGVHGSTIERALEQLENEGLLQSQGVGKRRLITVPDHLKQRGMHVVIVLYEREDTLNNYILDLQYRLYVAGHTFSFAPKTLRELGFDPKKIETMIRKHPAEAYIVQSAPRHVLEFLAETSFPVFALFGKMAGLPIPGTGTDWLEALSKAIEKLHTNGHRRIVLLTRGDKHPSKLGLTERIFLEELDKRNIRHGAYNLPEWENSPAGLRHCLKSLFQVTPPTAIFADDWMLYYAIQTLLIRERGPEYRYVSCISMAFHSSFVWSESRIPHFRWDPEEIVRQSIRWVNNVSRSKEDTKQKLVKAEFVCQDALTIVA